MHDGRTSVIPRKLDGFFKWEPCFFSPNVGRGSGDLKTSEVATPAGVVRLSISRMYCESEVINVYEWESRLTNATGNVDAVAVGSLFLKKPRSFLYPSEFELASAADQASEKDLILIDAYLELLDQGRDFCGLEQLCTVLTWERRLEATPGTGLVCLEAAIRLLKRKYRSINTLVIDSWPLQYRFGTATDSSATSIQNVLWYLGSINPGRWVGTDSFIAVHPHYDEELNPHDWIYQKHISRALESGNLGFGEGDD